MSKDFVIALLPLICYLLGVAHGGWCERHGGNETGHEKTR